MSFKQIARKKWAVRFYYQNPDTGKRSEKKLFGKSKNECIKLQDKFLKELEEKKEQLTYNTKNITMNEMYPEYFKFKEQSCKGSSAVTNKSRIEGHILPFFGEKKIFDITVKEVIQWKDSINTKGFSLEYSKALYNTLTNMFSYAMTHLNLQKNPATQAGNFKRPDEIKEKTQYWTYEQFKNFYSVINNDLWRVFFATLYFTGMRKGEIQALKWSDTDLSKKAIRIEKTLTRKTTEEEKKAGIWYKLTPPKTKASIRTILIPDAVVNLLTKHYNKESKIDGFNQDCFVFGTSRFLSDTSIDRYKNKYSVLANVPKIKIHDFRHSHASYLINNGANIMVVSTHLGHSDIKETLNTYSHMFPNFENQIIDFMNANIKL